ncbi:MAG: hypothetical protein ACK2TV_08840, partial [Anaerolineales bacterium]
TLEDNEIIEAAKTRSKEIVDQAYNEASVTQREADKYVLETLTNLEIHMDRLLNQVRNGIKTLQNEIYSSRQEQDNIIPPRTDVS